MQVVLSGFSVLSLCCVCFVPIDVVWKELHDCVHRDALSIVFVYVCICRK